MEMAVEMAVEMAGVRQAEMAAEVSAVARVEATVVATDVAMEATVGMGVAMEAAEMVVTAATAVYFSLGSLWACNSISWCLQRSSQCYFWGLNWNTVLQRSPIHHHKRN